MTLTLVPFGSALVPGRFDASDAEFEERIHAAADDTIKVLVDEPPEARTLDVPVDVVIVTETTDRDLPDTACPDGWRWTRKWKPYGASNVSILTRRSRFELHPSRAYAALLTDDQIWTPTGRLRPPHYALVVPLVDRITGHRLLIAGAHMPLRNTPRRALAAREAVENADTVWSPGREALGPDAVRLWGADWNDNAANKAAAAAWRKAFKGFSPTWLDDVPPFRRPIDWQAGGRGLVHMGTEYHRRPKGDPFDHPWSCTAWGYRVPAPTTPPPPPVPHVCTEEGCGDMHLRPSEVSGG